MYLRDPHSKAVRIFRWTVFLIATFYVLRTFIVSADYSGPGGPFRYLTHWALLLNFGTMGAMLALSLGRSTRDWGVLVGVAAVTNILIVSLYWRLFFIDPALVNNGTPVWWSEYYIHLLGPLLLLIDAVFVFGAFRHFWKSAAWLAVLVGGYILWMELFVGPMNDLPQGSVTSGLPYPFLNNMEFDDRLNFYATTCVSVFVWLVVFWALCVGARWVARRT